jgi:hypothetical protein
MTDRPAQPAPDRELLAEVRANLADNITLFSHHKAALLRLVDNALAVQPPAEPTLSEIVREKMKQMAAEAGHFPSSAGTIEAALRDAFPHFQSDEPITPEAIRGIGKEYLDMVMSWEPHKDEIEFADHNGTIRKIVYEPGDYEVGINPGWVLEDDTLDEPQTAASPEISRLIAKSDEQTTALDQIMTTAADNLAAAYTLAVTRPQGNTP